MRSQRDLPPRDAASSRDKELGVAPIATDAVVFSAGKSRVKPASKKETKQLSLNQRPDRDACHADAASGLNSSQEAEGKSKRRRTK
jgi:hypothetical protein